MSFKCPVCKTVYPAPDRPLRIVKAYRTTREGERQIAGEQEVCLKCAQRLAPSDPEVIRRAEGEHQKLRVWTPSLHEVKTT